MYFQSVEAPMAHQSLRAPGARAAAAGAEADLAPHQQMGVLTIMEKRFLLAVERGDVASTRR